MSDFDDIPAISDSIVDHSDEDEEQDVSSVDHDEDAFSGDGRYPLNGKYIYATCSKSTIESKDEFYQRLQAMRPARVRIFGGRELHKDDITPCAVLPLKFIGLMLVRIFLLRGIPTLSTLRSQSPGRNPIPFLRKPWRIAPRTVILLESGCPLRE